MQSKRFRGHRYAVPLAIIAGVSVIALAACGSNASSSGGSSPEASGTTPLRAGVLHAFTGQNAFFGLNAQNACRAAAAQIKLGGGIIGHPLDCANYDTKGDPADAVPVTTRMLVGSEKLVMVVGPDGTDIPSVLPLLEQAKVPSMNTVGDPRYDMQTSPYFWRLTPSDSTQAPALATYTISKGYTKIVDVWTNDLSASTTTTPFHSSFTSQGGTIEKTSVITPDQASYQTEVAAVLAQNPQAIVGEMDARTAATFMSEVIQQHGSMVPFVMTQRATQPDWAQAVGPAIGGPNLQKYVTAVAPNLVGEGVAYAAFQTSMDAIGANPFQKKNAFVAATYDGVIAFALAMQMSKSTNPSVYVQYIDKVTQNDPNATVVATYAQGVQALAAGKTIQYVGASGPMIFNQYNTAQRDYASWTHIAASQSWVSNGVIPSVPSASPSP